MKFVFPAEKSARPARAKWIAISAALCVMSFTALSIGLAGRSAHPEVTVGAAEVEAKFGSMPKGVTLEGVALGFPAIDARGVQYDPARNRFTLNGGGAQYDAPIARNDMVTVFRAIAGHPNQLMGVTIKTDKTYFMFGALDPRANISKDLAAADRILGGTVHATADYLRGVNLPGNYKPKSPRGKRTIWSAARFNFTGYSFAAQPGTATYRRAGYELVPTLTPVIPNAARDGGHRRNTELIRQGILGEPEDVENFNYLLANLTAFRQMPAIERCAKIGEAAAFARLLLQSGVDLNELARRM